MNSIYLLGFMGAGKSFWGKQLAIHLDYSFIDLDDFIEKQHKLSIPDLFNKYGETVFRKWEAKALRKTTAYKKTVIATGGGTPCYHDNLSFINNRGISCYLKVPLDILWERLEKDQSKRPLLQSLDKEELYVFIKKKLRERKPYYKRAHLTITPHNIDLKEWVAQLKQYYTK